VREQDLVDVHQPDAGAEQLPLGAFAAVDQQAIAATPDKKAGRATL
jgi:hypothetical protein